MIDTVSSMTQTQFCKISERSAYLNIPIVSTISVNNVISSHCAYKSVEV